MLQLQLFSVLNTEERKSLYLHQFARPAQQRLSSYARPWRRPCCSPWGTVRTHSPTVVAAMVRMSFSISLTTSSRSLA